MKHGVFCLALILLLAGSQSALGGPDGVNADYNDANRGGCDLGGFFGQLSTAEAVPQGAIDLGAYVGFYDDANALFGQFQMGVVRDCDWEVKCGVLDTEGGSDPHVMIGTGFKYRFYDRQERAAPDMAVNAIIEYYGLDDDGSSWIFGTGLIGSYPFGLSNNSTLTPYGRLGLRIERVTIDDYEDSDFDIGLNLGAQYAPSRRFQLYAELQIDDQYGFIGGINFAVY